MQFQPLGLLVTEASTSHNIRLRQFLGLSSLNKVVDRNRSSPYLCCHPEVDRGIGRQDSRIYPNGPGHAFFFAKESDIRAREPGVYMV